MFHLFIKLCMKLSVCVCLSLCILEPNNDTYFPAQSWLFDGGKRTAFLFLSLVKINTISLLLF